MSKNHNELMLGKHTDYPDVYSPELLFPIPRAGNRARIGVTEPLPFRGEDLWTAFELSWLHPSGKPALALAEFRIPATSLFMIESKSFKLYLNSLNQHVFADREALKQTLEQDLSRAAGAPVSVQLFSAAAPSAQALGLPEAELTPLLLDELEVDGFSYTPDAGLLHLAEKAESTEQLLVSDLLRSNCPVTGQPDWATVMIRYRGPQIDPASVLRYVVSFRQCQDFHEHCVERMFCDLLAQCRCEQLSVYARYTRRGGLDINPYRSTAGYPEKAPGIRLIRQ